MKCPKCNKEIPDTAKFCPYCGAKIESSEIKEPEEPKEVIETVSENNLTKEIEPSVSPSIPEKPKKKNKLTKVLAIIIGVLTLAIAAETTLLIFGEDWGIFDSNTSTAKEDKEDDSAKKNDKDEDKDNQDNDDDDSSSTPASKTKKTTCKSTTDDLSLNVDLYSKEDKITKLEATVIMTFEYMNVDPEDLTADEKQELLERYTQTVPQPVTGYTIDVSLTDEGIQAEAIIDLEKISPEFLEENNLSDLLTEDLDALIEDAELDGATCR